nr:hypothetical protein [Tanacetum cinerariifolium]
MSRIKWENVMASFEKGGLNIGSIKAFNLALLQKWKWRLVTNSDSIWARVIVAIHGAEAGTDLRGCYYAWNGGGTLMSRFNRLFHLDTNEDCLLSDRRVNDSGIWNWKRQIEGSRNEAALGSFVSDLGQVQLLDGPDSWRWSLDDDDIFSVHVTCLHIDSCIQSILKEVVNSVDKSSSESIKNGIKLKEIGSILEIIEEMITVGQTIGFSMEGCTKDMEKIIGTQGEQVVFR